MSLKLHRKKLTTTKSIVVSIQGFFYWNEKDIVIQSPAPKLIYDQRFNKRNNRENEISVEDNCAAFKVQSKAIKTNSKAIN